MSRAHYDSIQFGQSEQALIAAYGEPYDVKSLPDGSKELHYIERVPVRPDMADEHHYYFIIKDQKVISKRFTSHASNVELQFRNY